MASCQFHRPVLDLSLAYLQNGLLQAARQCAESKYADSKCAQTKRHSTPVWQTFKYFSDLCSFLSMSTKTLSYGTPNSLMYLHVLAHERECEMPSIRDVRVSQHMLSTLPIAVSFAPDTLVKLDVQRATIKEGEETAHHSTCCHAFLG